MSTQQTLVWDRPGGVYGEGIRVSELAADGSFLKCRAPTEAERIAIAAGHIPPLAVEKKPDVIVVGSDSTAEAIKQGLRNAGMDPDTGTVTGRRVLLVDSFNARYGMGLRGLGLAYALQQAPEPRDVLVNRDYEAIERHVLANMGPPATTYTQRRKASKRKKNKHRR